MSENIWMGLQNTIMWRMEKINQQIQNKNNKGYN